jgi:hypothetical protein
VPPLITNTVKFIAPQVVVEECKKKKIETNVWMPHASSFIAKELSY